MPITDCKMINDEESLSKEQIVEEFIYFLENLYDTDVDIDNDSGEVKVGEDQVQFSLYVPGNITREQFVEQLKKFEADYPGVKVEISKRWPKETEQAKQGLQMAKNAIAAYPERKTFEGMKPGELEMAKKLFKVEYGHEFNIEDPDDKEDILLLFNEHQRESREWYPSYVTMSFPKEEVEEVKEEEVKEEVTDEEDPKLKVCKLLGEAHDKIMEALDLVEDLENADEVSSSLRYDLEDLEAKASEFDFMGEDKPVDVMMGKYPVEEEWDGEEYEEEEE